MKKIWNFFRSVKLTLSLLVLLAGTSIIGTILPQQEAAGSFSQSLSPFLEKVFNFFQLFDMYHSWWFQCLIVLLVTNLIICTINRLPVTLKLYNLKPKTDRKKIFNDIPSNRILDLKGRDKTDLFNNVKRILNRQYKRVTTKENSSTDYLYAEKGRYSLFGVYIVHLSVILILIGAILGSFLGFRGFVNILSGGSVNSLIIRDRASQRQVALGFTVHCDKFSIDFYDNGTPKEYKSDIRFSVDGKTIEQGILRVNHPMTFRGITFYQASYGSTVGDKAEIGITQNQKDIAPVVVTAKRGQPVPLPDGKGEFTVEELSDNFMRLGPAVLITIKPTDGKKIQTWLFKNHDIIEKRYPTIFKDFQKLNPSIFKPFTFSLDDIELINYTGIDVNKDPGIFFIYLGFLSIIIGLFITFFSSHRRIWIQIENNSGNAKISIAGMANKNPVGMERELDGLAVRIRNSLK